MSNFTFKTDSIELTPSELKILDYFYKNIENIPFMPIGEIANHLSISTATLSRFVKHLGYNNFKHLKSYIFKNTRTSPQTKLDTALSKDDTLTLESLILRDKENLDKTAKSLSMFQIKLALEAIMNSKTIFIYGKGATKSLSYLLDFRLTRYGFNTNLLFSSGSEIFENMVNIKKEDVVMVLGFGKVPVEVKIILDYCKEIGCAIILFTDQLYQKYHFQSLISLYAYRGESDDFHTMTSPTAVIDILILLLGNHLKEKKSLENLNKLYELKEKYKNMLPR